MKLKDIITCLILENNIHEFNIQLNQINSNDEILKSDEYLSTFKNIQKSEWKL
jgi:hypothetical protein